MRLMLLVLDGRALIIDCLMKDFETSVFNKIIVISGRPIFNRNILFQLKDYFCIRIFRTESSSLLCSLILINCKNVAILNQIYTIMKIPHHFLFLIN